MASNEKVAEIVKWLRNKDYYRGYMGITYPLTDRMIGHILDRIEAAHKREVDAILKDRDEMFKSEQETIAKTNAWFGEYQTLKREVAELRACLKEAVTILNCHIDGNPETCDDDKCMLFDHENKSNCIMCKWRKALEGAKDEIK